MRRRTFIAGLGSAAASPVVGWAQQPAVPVIGFLLPQFAVDYKIETAAFLQGLKEAGFVAGQNVAVEYRYAENQIDRVPALAADLDRRRVAVIVTTGITTAGRRRQPPRPYPLSLAPALTRSHRVLWQASTSPAGTSPALSI
jgi:putative ABC transport system substrate-binding protein